VVTQARNQQHAAATTTHPALAVRRGGLGQGRGRGATPRVADAQSRHLRRKTRVEGAQAVTRRLRSLQSPRQVAALGRRATHHRARLGTLSRVGDGERAHQRRPVRLQRQPLAVELPCGLLQQRTRTRIKFARETVRGERESDARCSRMQRRHTSQRRCASCIAASASDLAARSARTSASSAVSCTPRR
jgi:hypothetical protein